MSCFDEWKKITSDSWVLDTVQGYKINFEQVPVQLNIPNQIKFSEIEKTLIDQEVNKMLKEGAIEFSTHENGEFISNLFLVPKPNGTFRPVINLKHLNEYVHYDKFKQETFAFVLELIQPNDWFISLDLRSAYWSIPIHQDCKKFLKFLWQDQLYAFVCLPFGISSAPFVFTKTLKPAYASFRKLGIRCSYYIDDSIGMNNDRKLCKSNAELMIKTLESLGFIINDEKSVVEPVQRITYFGFVIDSELFKIFLPEDKIQKIKSMGVNLSSKKFISIRELASFIGLIISSFDAVLEGPLHYRTLERFKVQALQKNPDFNSTVQLNPAGLIEINWWIENVQNKHGKKIRQNPITLWIQTDASNAGFGSYCVEEKLSTNGRWSIKESKNHINFLELLAIFFALKSWISDKHDIHVGIQSDSMVAIAYINDFGGMANTTLDHLAKNIWEFCLARNVFITAYHIPGKNNVEADFFSRHFSDSTEWMLKKKIFSRLITQLVRPNIDLFASRLNCQLEMYVSWMPDPNAFATNAFSLNWTKFTPYIFPPFCLMGAILNKIREDNVEQALIVCPFWTNQIWFPSLLQCMISLPIRLPRHKDILKLPHNDTQHPMGKKLQLIGTVVSGNPLLIEAFHRRLRKASSTAGDQAQESSIHQLGRNGLCGVTSNIEIPFVQLKN